MYSKNALKFIGSDNFVLAAQNGLIEKDTDKYFAIYISLFHFDKLRDLSA